MIDLNKEKRQEGNAQVPPTQSLKHELGHHNHALIMYALGTDPDIHMASNTLEVSSSLYGREIPEAPTRGMMREGAIRVDAEKYALLLGRQFAEADIENVEQQRQYLNELHSSFLEKKFVWFNAAADVYNNIAGGKQWELVGENPNDQQITRDFVGFLQVAFIFDEYFFNPNRTELPESLTGLIPEWQTTYGKLAGVIGSSFSIRQCNMLFQQVFNEFLQNHPTLIEKNEKTFEQILSLWKQYNVGLADNLETILFPKKTTSAEDSVQ
jgi:hypothetical protein